ncbi:putative mediator complex subunit 26 [Cavenderia fasciculata]|uniref:Mediator complex subunit 26 n=1 Tax=Cavenderia fasciculata TaxID=261658 RepID=F4PUW0_CACFS|nr:putative mediator complex subunit 26 [Cavenderia fasciculata]EGG21922.1 putative mediator complex subunit 26 [Cavenderia fasciculata]|eukprot:XP_004359773.1 putative mediator complex subunit 26 [Cavenderia fasciculata]
MSYNSTTIQNNNSSSSYYSNNNNNNNNTNMTATFIDYMLGIMNTIDIPQKHFEPSQESNALQSYYYLLYERSQQYQEYVTVTYNTPVVEDTAANTTTTSTSSYSSSTTTPLSPPPTTTIQSINSTLLTTPPISTSPPSTTTSSSSTEQPQQPQPPQQPKTTSTTTTTTSSKEKKEKEKPSSSSTTSKHVASKPLPIIGYQLTDELPTLEQYIFLNPLPKDLVANAANPKKKNWRDDKGSLSIVDRVPLFIQEFTVAASWSQLREFINVLENKITNSCRKRYVEEGGLRQLHTCLKYTQVSQCLPREIIAILKALKQLPITLEHLQKESGVGKIVRGLKKHDNASVRDLATDLERIWMNLVKSTNKDKEKEKEKEEDPKKRSRDSTIEKDPKKVKGDNGSSTSSTSGTALNKSQQQKQQSQSPTLPGVKKDLKEFEDLFMTKLGKQKDNSSSTTTTTGAATSGTSFVLPIYPTRKKQDNLPTPTTTTTTSTTPTSITSTKPTSPITNPTITKPQLPTINITSSGMESISLLDMTKVAPRNTASSSGWDLPVGVPEEDFEVVPDPNRRKSSKGRVNVRWAPDDKLLQIKEFESNEEIEEGDHDGIDFEKARQMEHDSEKLHHRQREIVATIEYKAPATIDANQISSYVYRPGTDSKERAKQLERENYTLMEIFLDSNIPENPQEPTDLEPDYDDSQVPIIPAEKPSAAAPTTPTTTTTLQYNDKIVPMNANETLDPSQIDEILSSFDTVNNNNNINQQPLPSQQPLQQAYSQNNHFNNNNNNNNNNYMGWSNQSYGNNNMNYNNNMWNNNNNYNNNNNMWNNNNNNMNNNNMNYNNYNNNNNQAAWNNNNNNNNMWNNNNNMNYNNNNNNMNNNYNNNNTWNNNNNNNMWNNNPMNNQN